MNEILLGCPHCSKPVGYAPAMAGKVVACPHCRGSFQMPTQPPAAPPKQAPPPPRPGPARPMGDGSLDFAPEQLPSGGGSPGVQRVVKAELGSYRAAETMATVFAFAGSLGVLVVAALLGYVFVLPIFRMEGGPNIPVGVMWIVSLFSFAFVGIVGMFLIRAVVLVVVDAARCTRAIERDVLANPVKLK